MSDYNFVVKRLSSVLRHLPGLSLIIPAMAAAVTPPPGAGTLDNQLRQTSPGVNMPLLAAPELTLPAGNEAQARTLADNGTRITLRDIRLDGTGATGLPHVPADKIRDIIAPALGKPLSFPQLQQLTRQLTELYRAGGALLARVIIPPQTIRDGVMTLTLVPGKYDAHQVKSSAPVSDPLLARIVNAQLPEGEVVTRQSLERLALLLNEIPGVRAETALSTGTRSGTAAVNVSARETERYAGYLGLDNLGTPATGRSRVTGGLFMNGLLGTGDQLRLDGALSYEHGGLTSGSIDYSMLAGSYGTRVGLTYRRMDYQYDFMQHTFSGYSNNWEARVVHPLIRSSQAQVNVHMTAGQSFLTDKYPGIFALTGREGRKTVTTGTAGMAGSFASLPGGITGIALDLTFGDMHYRDEAARFWSGSDLRDTAGNFTTLNWQFRHEQMIAGPFSFVAAAAGQVSDGNLDPSRKLVLGGPSAVRAYDLGDGAVDTGAVATAELRSTWTLPATWSISGQSPELTVSGFYDHGWGQQNRNNNLKGGGVLSDHNNTELAGAGVSVTLAEAGNYALSATWARRTTGADPVSGDRDSNRFWLSAVKTF